MGVKVSFCIELNTMLAMPLSKRCLESELEQLHQRYDNLYDTFQRATERYKRDFEKWRRFKNWIFDGQTATNAADKTKLLTEKRKLLTELGVTASDLDKEHSPGKVLVITSSDIESSPAKQSCSTTEDDDSQGM